VEEALKPLGWNTLEHISGLPYFSDLAHQEALAYWLDDIGYRRWLHQGTLYFYLPHLTLTDVQNHIRQQRKQQRHAASQAHRAGLISSAIKLPEEVHHFYWTYKTEHRQQQPLMSLYAQAVEYAVEHPEELMGVPEPRARQGDRQIGLRLPKLLMQQAKKIAKSQKIGITLFIRQALILWAKQQGHS